MRYIYIIFFYSLILFADIDVDRFDLGPFISLSKKNKQIDVRPIFSLKKDDNYSRFDILWPLASRELKGNRLKSYYGPVIINNSDVTNPNSSKLTWVLPFFLKGQNKKGEKYWGIFPFYGNVKDFISYDEVSWVLFPFYVNFKKNDRVSHSALWPFISWGEGKNYQKKGLWPIWQQKTTQYTKATSVLWPFLHYGTSKKSNTKWFSFFPFYSQIESDDSKYYSVLWPFFQYKKTNNFERINILWPFFQYKTITRNGNKKERLAIWPLFTIEKSKGYYDVWALWPFVNVKNINNKLFSYKALNIYPFYSSNYAYNKINKKYQSNKIIWPLFSLNTTNNEYYFEFPSLWSSHWNKSIHSRFHPFWTLYSQRKNLSGSEITMLFNTITYRKDKYKSRFAILGGFFGIENKSNHYTIQILWVKF